MNIYFEEVQKQYVQITFVSRDFAQNLINYGFLDTEIYQVDTINPFAIQYIKDFKKSHSIRMPNFGDFTSNRHLYLAFMLSGMQSIN